MKFNFMPREIVLRKDVHLVDLEQFWKDYYDCKIGVNAAEMWLSQVYQKLANVRTLAWQVFSERICSIKPSVPQ